MTLLPVQKVLLLSRQLKQRQIKMQRHKAKAGEDSSMWKKPSIKRRDGKIKRNSSFWHY